jgi:hypothetical protein
MSGSPQDVFLFLAGQWLLIGARDGAVRISGFLIAVGSVLEHFFATHWGDTS